MLTTESPTHPKGALQAHPATAYFVLAFAISWTGALVIAAPSLLRHTPVPRFSGILMFPAMLLGPLLGGILMTRVLDGKPGLRELLKSLVCWNIGIRWYCVLLLPPVLVLLVLSILT